MKKLFFKLGANLSGIIIVLSAHFALAAETLPSKETLQLIRNDFQRLDLNGDGKLSLREIELAMAASKKPPPAKNLLKRKKYAAQRIVQKEQKQAKFSKEPEKFKVAGIKLSVRKNFKEFTEYVSSISTDDFLDSSPAHFSYTHDFITKNDIWSVIGAVAVPFELYNTKEGASSTNFILSSVKGVAGVSLDYVSNEKSPANEVEKLGAHAALQFRFAGGGLLTSSYLTLEGDFTSDTAIKSAILTGDVDWMPVPKRNIFAVNSIRFLNEKIGYRTRAVARFRSLSVLDTGGNAALKKDEFARIGADLGADLYFGGRYLERSSQWLHIGAKWQFLKGVYGDKKFRDLLDLSLDFYPPGSTRISVNMLYRNGDVPLIGRRVKQFTLGIGVKL